MANINSVNNQRVGTQPVHQSIAQRVFAFLSRINPCIARQSVADPSVQTLRVSTPHTRLAQARPISNQSTAHAQLNAPRNTNRHAEAIDDAHPSVVSADRTTLVSNLSSRQPAEVQDHLVYAEVDVVDQSVLSAISVSGFIDAQDSNLASNQANRKQDPPETGGVSSKSLRELPRYENYSRDPGIVRAASIQHHQLSALDHGKLELITAYVESLEKQRSDVDGPYGYYFEAQTDIDAETAAIDQKINALGKYAQAIRAGGAVEFEAGIPAAHSNISSLLSEIKRDAGANLDKQQRDAENDAYNPW